MTFSREAKYPEDIIQWIDFVEHDKIYNLHYLEPESFDMEFTEAVHNTWCLLHHVARRRKWSDAPRRPLPNAGVVSAMYRDPRYSRSFVLQQLEQLARYCGRKAGPNPPLQAGGSIEQLDKLLSELMDDDRPVLLAIDRHTGPPPRLTGRVIAEILNTGIEPTAGGFKGRLRRLVTMGLLSSDSTSGYRLTPMGQNVVHRLRNLP